MRSLAHTLPDVVRVALVMLPADCWPLMIRRVAGVTLVWMDPRCTRRKLTDTLILRLTPDELAQVREAYGQQPTGPLESWTQEDRPALLYVPEQLRTRGAAALQGGHELRRRMLTGQLEMEWACVEAERIAVPVRSG